MNCCKNVAKMISEARETLVTYQLVRIIGDKYSSAIVYNDLDFFDTMDPPRPELDVKSKSKTHL